MGYLNNDILAESGVSELRSARLAWFCLIFAITSFAAGSPAIIFDRQIRPILSDNCFTCHGPDDKHRMANLHFDTRDGAFSKPGVIVPGDSAGSKLYQRISNPNAALRMPPTYSGHKLNAAQIDLIKNWIDQGANWQTHWAFVAPVRPPEPAVSDSQWPETPIDRFVLAKLDKEGLKPSPEAGKGTLLRRVTFDLTGLPPTPAELKAFLADSSPHAYNKVVDRLLASPHFGERMAMQWMDFARYSDTHGYHIDSAREMWAWRDWVIQAFSDNMPYDRFTIEQIAGDLLPNATQSQQIATGFNRNHMINFEGGAIPEEYQNEYMVDRIEATSTNHPRCFAMWFAGGGMKRGVSVGQTDDFSYNTLADPFPIHDVQATILHCLGIDHKRLTYKFQGRHFRLTDVAGNVNQQVLA
jgi:Protein of unknown function (DUF1549)/Protein of unknown function (DUF1501)/Planctomycete cytochrome C